ncbi:MGMT family protein [uncultured Corynebacterium sp.]|uniref:MGMT family protein n=1 Tax=uncultured Corynebacterium sp. TaxID=159447 RepID=UPI0025D387E1|nr:MGMT family protein [uncultured Corynebacterium sp.]
MNEDGADLATRVGTVLAVIGDGEVTGYGEIARALGLPRGARAVARVMASGGWGWDAACPVIPVGRTRGRTGHRCFVVPEMGEGENSRSAALARRAVSFTRGGSGQDAGQTLLIPTSQCLDAGELAERLAE